ncbi:MAG: coniferyl aldehyde dehydrogenase [Paucibacter sp.]|nr:coniferyl aldehyde dehydrogenase [Roseateles sp.]
MNAVVLERDAGQPEEALLRMNDIFARQRAAFAAERDPSEAVRRDRLDRAIALLSDHRRDWGDAMAADFCGRSQELTLIVDIVGSIDALRFARKNLRRWMAPERRRANFPYNVLGGGAEIQWQPKGVVGNIVPWNFPVAAMFAPLAGILAAGNRALIKFSELAPHTAALCEELLPRAFDASEVASVCGGPELGAAFAGLPFDHLLFTGSTRVGALVMQAAAANLTPVTLELGGKSPVVIGQEADLSLAARRVVWGKLLNAGQACIAPDYVLVPRDRLEDFIQSLQREVARQYPSLGDNPDYTSIISAAHMQRLRAYVEDARDRGARIVEINPRCEDLAARTDTRKLAPTLIVAPPGDSRVMQEEIFGPLLPLLPYERLSDAIGHITARPHPLALYCFGSAAEAEAVLAGTISGGAVVNDTMVHVLQDRLPFGGVGASGMGAYHAEFGFRTFSHARSVFRSPRADALTLLRPPYGAAAKHMLNWMARRR